MNNQKVSFTYPEGFIEAAKSLDFLPDEETQKQFLAVLNSVLIAL